MQPPPERPNRKSGWIVGILIGIFASLLAIAPARFILLGQLQFAVSDRSLPFISQFNSKPSREDIARLDQAAARHPDDYLIQVGRATALATAGGLKSGAKQHKSHTDAPGDNTLFRLGQVVQHFPEAPGAYAHLSRYMMNDRIRIERAETHSNDTDVNSDDSRPVKRPDPEDLSMMEWALHAGERRDKDNAFWPTMIATTCFAAGRDQDGAEALERAARKVRWDAYIYEEVLGEWRLYSAAYGDYGAVQKIGPLSLVSFPHLREIRKMAEFVRSLAEVAAIDGRPAEAVRLRHNLMLVGIVMRDRAQWAYEALIGTDVCLTAGTDAGAHLPSKSIRTLAEWKPAAQGYIGLLTRSHRSYELTWVSREVDNSCALRNRIDLARYDRSFPGIPPGIPLGDLFSSWMSGVCLIQQLVAAAILSVLLSLWYRVHNSKAPGSREFERGAIAVIFVFWLACGFLAFSGIPSTGFALIFLMLTAMVVVAGGCLLQRRSEKQVQKQDKLEDNALFNGAKGLERNDCWSISAITTGATFITMPALLALAILRGYLSGLHPIATALTSLVDAPHSAGVKDTLQLALLACAIPITTITCLTLIALGRKRSILASVTGGIARLMPSVAACLLIGYLALLNRTLSIDSQASRAISEAAQNDLQWVLTHSGDTPAQ